LIAAGCLLREDPASRSRPSARPGGPARMRCGWTVQQFLVIECTVTEQSAQLVGPPADPGEPLAGYLAGCDRRILSQPTRNSDKNRSVPVFREHAAEQRGSSPSGAHDGAPGACHDVPCPRARLFGRSANSRPIAKIVFDANRDAGIRLRFNSGALRRAVRVLPGYEKRRGLQAFSAGGRQPDRSKICRVSRTV